MSYEIRDVTSLGLDRLPSQFIDSNNIQKLLTVYLDKVQDVITEATDVLDGFQLENAIGVQLDSIGYRVGESRAGRSDDDYRIAIKSRITLNNSQGTPDDVITAAKILSGSDSIGYWEHYPASIILSIGNEGLEDLPSNFVSLMDSSVPAGVSVDMVFVDVDGDGFVYSELELEQGTIVDSDGDDLITHEGDYIAYQEVVSYGVGEQGVLGEIVSDSLVNVLSGEEYTLNGESWQVSVAIEVIGKKFYEVIT